MWATGAGKGLFGGIDRVPVPSGPKGCLVVLGVVALLVAGLLVMAWLFYIPGVVVYAITLLALTWRPLTRFERDNRARQAALQQEIRGAAAEDDTEFRVK